MRLILKHLQADNKGKGVLLISPDNLTEQQLHWMYNWLSKNPNKTEEDYINIYSDLHKSLLNAIEAGEMEGLFVADLIGLVSTENGINAISKQFLSIPNYTNKLLLLLKKPKNYIPSKSVIKEFNSEPLLLKLLSLLQKRGINLNKFSKQDILDLMAIRKKLILESGPSKFILLDLVDLKVNPSNKTAFTRYQNGKVTGNMNYHIEDSQVKPDFILNNSKNNTGTYYGGASEDIYNGAILYANQEGLLGFRSGDLLMSPEKTKAVWLKYPKGTHRVDAPLSETDIYFKSRGFPINSEAQLLIRPSYEVPTKSIVFDPTMVQDNLKPIWSNKDLYKTISFILGNGALSKSFSNSKLDK